MNDIDPVTLWTVIIGLAVGSFALRFAFIGIVGGRVMPEWLMRHLRYTAVAIIPALVAPLVVWPAPTGGEPSAIHLVVGCATLAVGYFTRNIFAAMGTGAVLLVGYLSLIG